MAAPKTRSRCGRIARHSSGCASIRACSSTSRRSIYRPISSARARRCRSPSPPPAASAPAAPAPLPLATAPTGGISAGRAGAELALARAASAFGVPFTLATPAAFTIERVAEAAAGGRLWFQLYAVREHEFREKLIARAKNAGYDAMLVTVDLPVSGKRERDPRNGFRTPYNPNWRNSRDVIFKPAWLCEIVRHGLPGMANFDGYRFSTPSGTDIATAVGREMDAALDWEAIRRIRDLWPRKLLLKGVERPDDAERAAAIGCDGVVVSNHGGRQLD